MNSLPVRALSKTNTVIIHAELSWIGATNPDRTVELVLTTEQEVQEHHALAIIRILHPNQFASVLEVERI